MSDVALVACEVFKDQVTAYVERGVIDATPYFVDPACRTDTNNLEFTLRRILPVACRYFDHVIVLFGRCHPNIQEIAADYQAVRVAIESCLDVLPEAQSPDSSIPASGRALHAGVLVPDRTNSREALFLTALGRALSPAHGLPDYAGAERPTTHSRNGSGPFTLAYLIRESILQARVQEIELENAKLKQELARLRRSNAELTMLDNINRELSTNLNLDSVAARLVDKAVELTGAEESSLVLCDIDGEKQQLRCLAVSQNVKFTGAKRVLAVTNLAGWVAQNRQMLVIKRGAQDLPVPEPQFVREKVTSYIGLPLIAGSRVIAVLQVFNLPVRERAEEYARALTSLAAIGAITLQNAISHRLVRQERNKLNAVFNKVSDAIRLVDSRLRIVDMNAAAEELTGWPAREAIGRSCCEVFCCRASIGGLRPRSELCLLQQVLSKGEAIPYAEGAIRRRDGRMVDVVSSFAPIIAVSGWREYVAAIDRDASRIKELERSKSQFIAVASHELRTPLASIVSAAETLLRPDVTISRRMRMELLQMIKSSGQRLASMTADLARAAQIDQYDLRLDVRPVEIGPLMERIVRQFSIHTRSHRITLDIPCQLPLALVDAERLQDVMANLLSNAVKYSPHGSEVTVRITLRHENVRETKSRADNHKYLEVSVSDQGIGIAADELDKVFQRFYRGHGAPASSTGGMGLGLSICKTYIELMNGRIWVESREGQGSTFTFTIPAAA